LLTLDAGNLERDAGLQYGGRLGPDLTYRFHAEYLDYSAYKEENGTSANDGWSKPQGGFRVDWTPNSDAVNLEGDIYTADENPNGYIFGRDALASWKHQFQDGSNLQIQTFGDEEGRFDLGSSGFTIDTFDIEAQHSITLGGINAVVWGAGERNFSYHFENTALQLVPPNADLNLANIFAQDTIAITDRLKLTPGLKLEIEPYAGAQLMPSVRLGWKVTDDALLWGAISRALRSPTPVDESIREYSGSTDVLNGSSLFQPEKLTSYEAGSRVQITANGSFSISTYYNVYDDLRSIEPSATFFPLQFRNLLGGHVYGVEVWGDYRVTDWWRLTAGVTLQHENLRFLPASSGIGGLAWVADDPNHQLSLRSAVDLGSAVTWDTSFRYVGVLPHPVVPAYAEIDTKLGWKVTPKLELSVAGNNLLHPQHEEFYEDGETDEVPRSFYLAAQWRF
jgi:iron complex outermembrane receptor protein